MSTGHVRSTWVWSFTDAPLLVAATQAFDVQRLLIWASPGFTTSATTMRRLEQLATLTRESGQEIDALCGDPSWATNPAESGRYSAEVARSELFARVHLDIEPHAAPGWKENQPRLISGYLQALALAGDAGLPVDADIPYWYDTVFTRRGERLDRAVMKRVASVTLMSYRDSAAAVLTAALPEMTAAAAMQTPAHIGVNLAPPGADGPNSSFYGQSDADIRTAIGEIEVGGTRWASFAGLALHHCDYLP